MNKSNRGDRGSMTCEKVKSICNALEISPSKNAENSHPVPTKSVGGGGGGSFGKGK